MHYLLNNNEFEELFLLNKAKDNEKVEDGGTPKFGDSKKFRKYKFLFRKEA